MRRAFMVVTLALGALPMLAFSQTDDAQKESLVKALQIPETPAFAVLGVTPSEVTRPGAGRDVAIGLLQGLDANGNMQSGIAYEFVPYLIANRDVTLTQYRGDNWTQIASRTKLSLATSKGSDESDQSLRAAIGLRATIFDRGDPYLKDEETVDLTVDPTGDDENDRCFRKAMSETTAERLERMDLQRRRLPPPEGQPTPPDHLNQQEFDDLKNESNERRKARIEESADRCRKSFEQKHWNSTALDVGVAPVWISPDGTTNELDQQGYALWTSFQWGFEGKGVQAATDGCGTGLRQQLRTCAALQLLAKYRNKELVEDPLDPQARIEQDSMAVGLRFRFGSKRRVFLVESTYADVDPRDRASSHEWRYIVGGEFRISEDTWLQLIYASIEPENGDSEGVVSSHFAWAFGDSNRL